MKRIGIAFLPPLTFFSDLRNVFGFLVTLLYIIGKKVIFSKFLWFLVIIFVLLYIQHIWFGVYQIYTQHIYWANLVQKFNIVNYSWNLARKLTQICRIRWWCSLFLLQAGSALFGQIWCKDINIVSLGWNLTPSLIEYVEFNGDAQFCSFRPEISYWKFCTRNNSIV